MNHREHASEQNHYRQLLGMAVLSLAAMYVLMYVMVDTFGNMYNNVNQLYMAGLMTAPMIVIELLVMRGMYRDRTRNVVILTASVAVRVVCVIFIRQQTGVSDRQFLRSMIPHHAAAILMCEESPIQNAEILKLCRTIITGQQVEIDQMKTMLHMLEK